MGSSREERIRAAASNWFRAMRARARDRDTGEQTGGETGNEGSVYYIRVQVHIIHVCVCVCVCVYNMCGSFSVMMGSRLRLGLV